MVIRWCRNNNFSRRWFFKAIKTEEEEEEEKRMECTQKIHHKTGQQKNTHTLFFPTQFPLTNEE